MKILVNATPLLNIPTGIGRYLKSLYSQMGRLYPETEINYFDGKKIIHNMPESPQDSSIWSRSVNIAWRLPSLIPYLARGMVHEKRAKRFLRLSEGFDIYHESGYFPFKAAKNVKTIFTIHDISLKTVPGFHPKERVRFFNKYFENSLQHVNTIITPSEFTKREIITQYPDSDIGIHPIPLGFDKHIFARQPENVVDDFKGRRKLPEKYILFVGTADPRKNIQSITAALAHLPESVKLVCAGWTGWLRKKEHTQTGLDISNRIIFTGYLSDSDLAILYSGARAFVYPSFYEGFGLPVLEAMACGCPVVCSYSASLPEVAGNAALTCNPDDIRCLANSISAIFREDSLYTKMSLKSQEQAKKFSWAKTAEDTINVFKKTISC